VWQPRLARERSAIARQGPEEPGRATPEDGFAARSQRTVELDATRYRFVLRADGGVRLQVGDTLQVDQWHLSAGLEYGDGPGAAYVSLDSRFLPTLTPTYGDANEIGDSWPNEYPPRPVGAADNYGEGVGERIVYTANQAAQY